MEEEKDKKETIEQIFKGIEIAQDNVKDIATTLYKMRIIEKNIDTLLTKGFKDPSLEQEKKELQEKLKAKTALHQELLEKMRREVEKVKGKRLFGLLAILAIIGTGAYIFLKRKRV